MDNMDDPWANAPIIDLTTPENHGWLDKGPPWEGGTIEEHLAKATEWGKGDPVKGLRLILTYTRTYRNAPKVFMTRLAFAAWRAQEGQ